MRQDAGRLGYLADTTQRGGSALTVMEGEDFDALVFGERVPGRWMAGSDFFRRTQDEQAQQANTAETAGTETLVQIAAVWAGNDVAIYRNGRPYARYLDDILMECYSLPSRATGRIGVFGGGDAGVELGAWR